MREDQTVVSQVWDRTRQAEFGGNQIGARVDKVQVELFPLVRNKFAGNTRRPSSATSSNQIAAIFFFIIHRHMAACACHTRLTLRSSSTSSASTFMGLIVSLGNAATRTRASASLEAYLVQP